MHEVMTIKDAKIKLAQCEINLEYWINEKNMAINSVMPKSKGFDREVVSGGTREDKYKKLDYAIDEIDPIIEYLNKEISNLNNFIEQSLKVLGEYDDLQQRIYELRHDKEYMRKNRGRKRQWWKIAQIVGYSERQVQRIYSQLVSKRND